jgi:hypothetical protein
MKLTKGKSVFSRKRTEGPEGERNLRSFDDLLFLGGNFMPARDPEPSRQPAFLRSPLLPPSRRPGPPHKPEPRR